VNGDRGPAATLTLRAGRMAVPTLVYRPESGEPARAGIAVVTEAQGVNAFIRGVAAELAAEGFVVAVPDYYHGEGPADPEQLVDLAHLAELQEHIERLDFRQGVEDVLVAVDHLFEGEGVLRAGVWGYCTGGTLAMLGACLDRRVAASVLYYPSQPTFAALSDRHPQHPLDLLWALRRPALLVIGEDDPVWPPALRQEVAARAARWSLPLEVDLEPGAGHAFASHFEDWHRPEATAASWDRSLALVRRHLYDEGER
jgi:carboxymethylenebutenolidase